MDSTVDKQARVTPQNVPATQQDQQQQGDAPQVHALDAHAQDTAEPAWYSRASHAWLWSTAALGLVADLISKYMAFETLPAEKTTTVIPQVLCLYRSLNTGALFGIGRGMTGLFIGASILAIGFVLYMFRRSQRRQRLVHVALGLVLAGALGNLYDRIFVRCDVVRQGDKLVEIGKIISIDQENNLIEIGRYPDGGQPIRKLPASPKTTIQTKAAVRDFIKIDFVLTRWIQWPWIFNLADVMLVIGVGLLVILFWRHSPSQAGQSDHPVDAPSEITTKA